MSELLKSFGIQGKILLWQVVNFGILFLALWFILYKPIRRLLEEREGKVAESLEKAEQLEKKSQALEGEFRQKMIEQRKELEELHTKALKEQEKIKKEMRERTEKEAQKFMEEARTLALEEKAQILQSLEQEVKQTAVFLAGKILEKEIDEEKQKELLVQAIKILKNG